MTDSNPPIHAHPLPRLTKQAVQSALRPRLWPEPFTPERTRFYFRGSNALWHALKALRLEAGSQVLFPAYHCGIELDVLSAAGMGISFYGVGRGLTLDARTIEQQVGPETRALYVIHYYGIPQDLTEILALCRRHRLALIEDCAMALYSRREGRPVGGDGDVAVFSLWKSVAMPFGGALVVNNPDLQMPEPGQPPSGYEVLRATKQLLEMEFRGTGWFEGVRKCLEPLARAARGVSAKTSHDSWRKQPLWVPLFAVERGEWGMTAVSRHLFLTADHEAIRMARRRNYLTMDSFVRTLSCVAPLLSDLPAGACPLYYPVTVEDPVAFRRFLRARGLETFMMWRELHPLFPAEKFSEEASLRAHVVALPVHQHLDSPAWSVTREALTAWDRGRESHTLGSPQTVTAEQCV
ncbi:MAG: DegT/DnrJ/EryC1/StrS family aminotransferase [Nitrospiraceae bacterium]|nr:DegT/DnrJ/EryC1/StrS family aminotransferase [Nitrospiraceae bacterium]